MRLARHSRNECCEDGLGYGVAVFYEPLKFYSSQHWGSLRPWGHHALNKLSSVLHPIPPNICLPNPTPETLPPTDLMDCLLFDVLLWLHRFFSLPLPLSFFALHLCSVAWKFEWCGLSVRLYYLLLNFACKYVCVCVCACSLCLYVSRVHIKTQMVND